MLAGVVLVLAGLGILFCARTAGEVNQEIAAAQARQARAAGAPRLYQRMAALNARIGARATVVIGIVIGLAAIIGGVVFIATA